MRRGREPCLSDEKRAELDWPVSLRRTDASPVRPRDASPSSVHGAGPISPAVALPVAGDGLAVVSVSSAPVGMGRKEPSPMRREPSPMRVTFPQFDKADKAADRCTSVQCEAAREELQARCKAQAEAIEQLKAEVEALKVPRPRAGHGRRRGWRRRVDGAGSMAKREGPQRQGGARARGRARAPSAARACARAAHRRLRGARGGAQRREQVPAGRCNKSRRDVASTAA